MQTIQIQLADDLVTEIDKVVKENNTNRSAFIHEALQKALEYYHERKLIEKHRQNEYK